MPDYGDLYAISTYKLPSRLFIVDGQELKSLEGTTQGDPQSIVLYAIRKKAKRLLEFAAEKGTATWLTVIPISEMNFKLNKREFRDALNLRYDWNISDSPSIALMWGDVYYRSRNDM